MTVRRPVTVANRAKAHGRPVGYPLCRPIGRAIAASMSRSTVCMKVADWHCFHAERTEADPGREPEFRFGGRKDSRKVMR
jgi:hypothetical protein